MGDYGRAIADFNQAVALVPHAPHSYLYRGIARQEQGQITEAVAYLVKAVELATKLRMVRVSQEAELHLSEPGTK